MNAGEKERQDEGGEEKGRVKNRREGKKKKRKKIELSTRDQPTCENKIDNKICQNLYFQKCLGST